LGFFQVLPSSAPHAADSGSQRSLEAPAAGGSAQRDREPFASAGARPPNAVAAPDADDDSAVHARARSTEPAKLSPYLARGEAALRAKQFPRAKRAFERALQLAPASAAAHTGLGYVELHKKHARRAVEHFVVAADAGYGEAWMGLGDAYRRLRRTRDALHAYQNYIARSPNGDGVNAARAQVHRLSYALSAAPTLP
jgi:cytochrome c-type biogenesis protein CcmH/NrfG